MFRQVVVIIAISVFSSFQLQGNDLTKVQAVPMSEYLQYEQSIIKHLKRLKEKGFTDNQIVNTLLEEYANNSDQNEQLIPQSKLLWIACGGIAVTGLMCYLLYIWNTPANFQQAERQSRAVQFNFLPGYAPTNRERHSAEQTAVYIENVYSNVSSSNDFRRAGIRVATYVTIQSLNGELPYENMTVSLRMADLINGMRNLP